MTEKQISPEKQHAEALEQYDLLTERADRCRRANNGEPGRAEAVCLMEAAFLAQRMQQKLLGHKEFCALWREREADCLKAAESIVSALRPRTPEPPKDPEIERQKLVESWFRKDETLVFDRILGREALKAQLLQICRDPSSDPRDQVKLFLFYGFPGINLALVGEALANELGYSCLRIPGSKLSCCLVGETERNIRAAFDTASERTPCVICLEDAEEILPNRSAPWAEGYQKRFTTTVLEALAELMGKRQPVIVIACSDDPNRVEEAYARKARCIRFDLPDVQDRQRFLEELNTGRPHLEEGLTFRQLAEETALYQLPLLKRLWDEVMGKVKEQVLLDCQVTDAQGRPDFEATDRKAADAILSGKVRITHAMVREAIAQNPPPDWTVLRQRFADFEKN